MTRKSNTANVSKNRFATKLVSSFLSAAFLQVGVQVTDITAAQAEVPVPTVAAAISSSTDSQQYTDITKKILLAGIDLERYSLNFRLNSGKQPKFRRFRYVAEQEAGSACGLTFEIIGDQQFGKGRRRPLRISKPALQHALGTAMIGSIIAGGGSYLELGSNEWQAIKNKQHGYDHPTAIKCVKAKLKTIDALLAQREALVAAHSDVPGYERAVVEGKIFKAMRDCFIDEFSNFNADTKSYMAFQNAFFLLNGAYNTVGAAAAGVAYKAVTLPHLNGTANIMFIVSGGMASVSPFISGEVSNFVRKQAFRTVAREVGSVNYDPTLLADLCKKLDSMPAIGEGSMIPSLPATQRLALYTQSDDLFRVQLQSETVTMRKLEKVALQTSILGPLIGGQLATQGILGTHGYYSYPLRPRRQIAQYFYGSVVGTVGTSMATVGNAAWLLSSLAYEHHLSKQHKLPNQLIAARLDHLNELEKTVSAL